MRNALITFLSVLLATGLALFLYHHYAFEPRLQQSETRERVALDEAREEAKAIAEELESSVQETVRSQREAADELAQREDARREVLAAQSAEMQAQAQAAEALMRAGMVKLAIAEHYMSMGEWPARLQDMGMGAPEDHAGGPVRSIRLGEEGEIVIEIEPSVAANASLHLLPKVSPVGMIDWQCRAKGYEAATRLPACRD